MTNTKNTKRALLSSVLAMLLCFSMLLGTTFAWFTDSVTSANNIITAGNLNIELYHTDDKADCEKVNNRTMLFDDIVLWEPGAVVYETFDVVNEGNLALKYQLSINVSNATKNANGGTLADVLMVGVIENGTKSTTRDEMVKEVKSWSSLSSFTLPGELEAKQEGKTEYPTDTYTVVIYWLPNANDNAYNMNSGEKPLTIDIGVTLLATQLTSESDSFGPDYDKDSSAFVSSSEELKNALANVKDGGTVYVNDGTYNISSQLNIAGKSVNIVGVGEDAVIRMTDKRTNYNKFFYIYGSADGEDVTVNISNVTLVADVATKSDIWIRTDAQNGAKVNGNVTVNLDNVNCTSIICDNNYVDGDTVNLNITNSNVKKVTLDASPFNGNGLNTYTNLTYSGSRIDSINIQNGAAQALNNITINGVKPTATGEQQPLTYVDTTEELQAALDNAEDGDEIIVSAGTYGVIDVRNVNCSVTLAAVDGTVVNLAGINGQSNSTSTNLTVKGITIDNSLQTEGWYTGTAQKIKPCVGVWGGNYTFVDCTFFVTGESGAETGVMSWWTTDRGTMTFKGCTFNGGNDSARAMQIYGNYDLNVEGCTFNTKKDYSIKYVGSDGCTATFKNNNVNNTTNFVQTGSAPYAGEDYALKFENNILADGINHVYVDNDENQTITIDGVSYGQSKPAGGDASANFTSGNTGVKVPVGAPEGYYTLATSEPVTTENTATGETTVSLDITLLKDGVKVANDGTTYTVSIEIGTDKIITAVNHNGNAVEDYTYNPATGIITFDVYSFSPFAVSFKDMTVVTGLSGEGTAENPYLINNYEELCWFRDHVNSCAQDGSSQYAGKVVKLNADIDLKGIVWEPIGSATKDHGSFYGIFDGGNHTISNLYVNTASGAYAGLFAKIGHYNEALPYAQINNLTIVNADVSSAGSYVGAVVGNAGGNVSLNNVHVKGYVCVEGYGYVGGIVGHGYPKFTNCTVDVEESSYVICNYWCGGGIIGYAGEGGTRITDCSVKGLYVWSAYGAGGAVAGLLNEGNALKNVHAENVVVETASDYICGFVCGNGEESTYENVTMKNVTSTANGNAITSTDNENITVLD